MKLRWKLNKTMPPVDSRFSKFRCVLFFLPKSGAVIPVVTGGTKCGRWYSGGGTGEGIWASQVWRTLNWWAETYWCCILSLPSHTLYLLPLARGHTHCAGQRVCPLTRLETPSVPCLFISAVSVSGTVGRMSEMTFRYLYVVDWLSKVTLLQRMF